MKLTMKKVLSIFISIFLIIGIFAGCAQNENKGQQGQAPLTTQQVQKNDTANFPLTVKDANGFEFTINKKPEKIVSLNLGTDEMLLAMVDKTRIKALSTLSSDPEISNVADIAKDFPTKVGSEAEKVIALQPDLVFVASWQKKEFIQQLRDAKIAVYVYKTPSSIEELKVTLKDIAHVVGEDAKGHELVSEIDKKLKGIEDKLKNIKPEQKLTVIKYDSFGTAGKGTTFDDIVTRAGLVNLVSKAGMEKWPQLSKEKIVEFNPDIIIAPSYSYDTNKSAQAFVDEIKNDKSLANVKAVKNNRVIMIPEKHIASISQYMVMAVEDVAKAAYPELFK